MTPPIIPGDLLLRKNPYLRHLVYEVTAIEANGRLRVRRLGLSSGTMLRDFDPDELRPLRSPYRWCWFHSEPGHIGVWALHLDGAIVPDRFLRVEYIPVAVQPHNTEPTIPALWGAHTLSVGASRRPRTTSWRGSSTTGTTGARPAYATRKHCDEIPPPTLGLAEHLRAGHGRSCPPGVPSGLLRCGGP